MKVTIKEINGVKHTVVMIGDVEAGKIAESDRIIDWRGVHTYIQGKYAHPLPVNAYVIGYALPPLPRLPTADDVPLLHLYAGHGIDVHGTYYDGFRLQNIDAKGMFVLRLIKAGIPVAISHAMHNGERVEIAIKEEHPA